MSSETKPTPGSIVWTDLTVPDAGQLRTFYGAVAGWSSEPVSMGEYEDFNMLSSAGGEPVAGICHARGPNANLPSQWLMYVSVKDLDGSIRECLRLGGKVVDGPRPVGKQRFCTIQDPAGAVLGLIEG